MNKVNLSERKILMVFVVGLFLISFVSAEVFTFDNKVDYVDDSLLKVDIVNTFGLGETIGTIELKSHKSINEVLKVGYGSYNPVMIYEFSNWELYENGLGNVYFKNMKNGEDTEKLWYFAEWKLVKKNETEFEKGEMTLNKNGTKIYEQIPKEVNHDYYDWVRYDSKDIPNTKTEIRKIALMVYTEKGEYTDAIWTLAGKRIKEHAEWTADLSVDLDAYYKLHTQFGVGKYDDSILTYNRTASGGITNTTGVSATTGYAYSFSGGYIDYPTTFPDYVDQDYSYNLWTYTTTCGTTNSRLIYRASSFSIQNYNGYQEEMTAGAVSLTCAVNTWTMITITYDHSANMVYMYRNYNAESDSSNFDGIVASTDKLTIGNRGDQTKPHAGKLDELAFWGRKLSTAEISDLYNSGSGLTLINIEPLISPNVTLNSPVDNYNSSSSEITFNITATDDLKIENVSLLINGIINQTNTSNYNGTYIFTKALGNGLHNWSILAYDNNSQANQSETRIVNITVISPTINLYSPENNLITSTATHDFIGDVTDDKIIINVSYYYDGTLDQTNSSGLKDVNYTFSKTLTEGIHTWYYKAYDNDSNPTDSATRTITLDTEFPIINVTSPDSDNYVNYASTNQTSYDLAWSVSDSTLDTCIVTNVSSGTNITGTCNDMNATYYFPFGIKNVDVWANDSLNRWTRELFSNNYGYKVYEINQTFNNPVIEGSVQSLYANIYLGSGYSISNVKLDYNGTNYSGTYSNIGSYWKLTKSDLNIPSVTADENETLIWYVTLTDASVINLSSQLQQINNFVFSSDCSANPYLIYKLSLVDERTQVSINGTIETSFLIYNKNRNVGIYNWTSTIINNTASLCSSIDIPSGTSFSVDGTIRYYSQIDSPNSTAMVEYYNLLNSTLSATAKNNITLYDINTTEGTEFQLTFSDSSFQKKENILIYVYRQYIPEDFKIVEIPKTDSNGQTVVHLVRNDVIYNLIAVDLEGNTLGSLNNIIAFCKDYTIGQCEINFNAQGSGSPLENVLTDVGVSYSLDYNNVSNNVGLNFVSLTIDSKNVRMEVISAGIVTNRTICSDSLDAVSGILTCDVSSVVNTTSSVYVYIYVDDTLKVMDTLNFDTSNNGIPTLVFIGFLLVLTLGIFFMESKEGTIIITIIGFIVLIALGIIKGKVIGIGSGIIWLMVVGVILLIKLNSENK